MAQSKSFFGLRSGSTKSLTFSVYNGKQVTKDRVYVVKNPRSALQMKQRAIMATAMHAYSALKEICDHSFEGISYGQPSMNYFVSRNASLIRSAAPRVNLSSYKGISVSNAYEIAKGSLPSISVSQETVGEDMYWKVILGNIQSSGFTFGKLMEILGANKVGDMVTFVQLVNNTLMGNASTYWVRLQLTEENKSKALTIQAGAPTNIMAVLTEGIDFETSIDNFSASDFPIAVSYTSGYSVLQIGEGVSTESNDSQSLGVILSRKSDSGWLRSNATMVNLFDRFNYDAAIATYPENGEKILNGGNV